MLSYASQNLERKASNKMNKSKSLNSQMTSYLVLILKMEDIELMHSLGTNAYRFSISWARILPDGMLGSVNPRGVIFYNKLIDNLLSKGIEPFVTIHHSDLPQVLEQRDGGWLSPLLRNKEEFVHFASICFESFGDGVKYWVTINEPNMVADFAYLRGLYPPARCSPPFGNCSTGNSDTEPLIGMHNMLIAHAMTVEIYRTFFWRKQNGFIGIVAHAFMYEPLRDEERDRDAVDRALAFNVAWTFDPVVYGDYPAEMRHCHGLELPRFSAKEKQLLRGSIDFVGVNHYSTLYVKDCIHSPCPSGGDRPIMGFLNTTGYRDGVPIGEPTGLADFFVVPRGMEKIIDYVKQRYNNMPLFVTENEVADVRGYFVWSVMDNFEWVKGYTKRFGLYYVDRETLERTPKLSVGWFASFLRNNSHNDREEIMAASGHNKTIIFSQLEAKVAEM
ncbi:hypothetical protein GBA52_013894 [Prunus armeniaca]|nr:hypothetical protein GBA52_013894 [Prunus armeniaca]